MSIRDFFDPVKRLRRRLDRLLRSNTLPENLRPYFARPLPESGTPLSQLEIIAFDFETTGLDFAKDHILSCGGISICDQTIDFSGGFHQYFHQSAPISPETILINGITPEMMARGLPPEEGLPWIFDHLAGHVVLCHFGMIERNFLCAALKLPPRSPLPMIFVDTMELEKSLFHAAGQAADLRLFSIRARRGFPAYAAHNAFADSVATAELFLAQKKEIFGSSPVTLGEVLRRSPTN